MTLCTSVETEEMERLELESEKLSYCLPTKEALDRILRYETTIKRQLYRAMNQLERLQRSRRGDAVPPPISLDVGSET